MRLTRRPQGQGLEGLGQACHNDHNDENDNDHDMTCTGLCRPGLEPRAAKGGSADCSVVLFGLFLRCVLPVTHQVCVGFGVANDLILTRVLTCPPPCVVDCVQLYCEVS